MGQANGYGAPPTGGGWGSQGQNIDTLPMSASELAWVRDHQAPMGPGQFAQGAGGQGGQVNPFGANTPGGQNYASQMAGHQAAATPVNPFGANTPGGQNYANQVFGNAGNQPQQQPFRYFEGPRPANAWQPQQAAPPPQPQFGGAPDLYKQYQGLAQGWSPEREAMIRQMQGTDNGAAFNQNMKAAGYQLGGGMGGNFNYKPPPNGFQAPQTHSQGPQGGQMGGTPK